MSQFVNRGDRQEQAASAGGSGESPVPPSAGGRSPAPRALKILRAVYVVLVIAGVVGAVLGLRQGLWLVVVVVVFWLRQEFQYGFLQRKR